MKNNDNNTDLQHSVEDASPEEIKDNLKSNESNKPENLSEEEHTPFIDEDVRTDK